MSVLSVLGKLENRWNYLIRWCVILSCSKKSATSCLIFNLNILLFSYKKIIMWKLLNLQENHILPSLNILLWWEQNFHGSLVPTVGFNYIFFFWQFWQKIVDNYWRYSNYKIICFFYFFIYTCFPPTGFTPHVIIKIICESLLIVYQ